MTAADKYYLKAKDNYPYDMEEVMEALEYGLSADDMHPGLLTLQGEIYHHQLHQFDAAKACFETALYSDSSFVDAYYAYIRLTLWMNGLKQAGQLIDRALGIPGIDRSLVLYHKAILLEKQSHYKAATNALQEAIQFCHSRKCYGFYMEEIERIQAKDKSMKEHKAAINILIKE